MCKNIWTIQNICGAPNKNQPYASECPHHL